MRLVVVLAEPLAPTQVRTALGAYEADEVDLAPLIDRLAPRLGATRGFCLLPTESDASERSVARSPPLAGIPSAT